MWEPWNNFRLECHIGLVTRTSKHDLSLLLSNCLLETKTNLTGSEHQAKSSVQREVCLVSSWLVLCNTVEWSISPGWAQWHLCPLCNLSLLISQSSKMNTSSSIAAKTLFLVLLVFIKHLWVIYQRIFFTTNSIIFEGQIQMKATCYLQ